MIEHERYDIPDMSTLAKRSPGELCWEYSQMAQAYINLYGEFVEQQRQNVELLHALVHSQVSNEHPEWDVERVLATRRRGEP